MLEETVTNSLFRFRFSPLVYQVWPLLVQWAIQVPVATQHLGAADFALI
jgi:hypothetical protein